MDYNRPTKIIETIQKLKFEGTPTHRHIEVLNAHGDILSESIYEYHAGEEYLSKSKNIEYSEDGRILAILTNSFSPSIQEKQEVSITHTYDQSGRIVKSSKKVKGSTPGSEYGADYYIEYLHLDGKQRIETTFQSNGVICSRSQYDKDGRLIQEDGYKTGQHLYTVFYKLDAAGHVIEISQQYDSSHPFQQSAICDIPFLTDRFEFDPYGNETAHYIYGDCGKLLVQEIHSEYNEHAQAVIVIEKHHSGEEHIHYYDYEANEMIEQADLPLDTVNDEVYDERDKAALVNALASLLKKHLYYRTNLEISRVSYGWLEDLDGSEIGLSDEWVLDYIYFDPPLLNCTKLVLSYSISSFIDCDPLGKQRVYIMAPVQQNGRIIPLRWMLAGHFFAPTAFTPEVTVFFDSPFDIERLVIVPDGIYNELREDASFESEYSVLDGHFQVNGIK